MLESKLIQCYSLIDKLIMRGLSLPSELAFQIFNLDLVEQKILLPRYQRFIEASQQSLPQLDAEELKIVETLENEGIYRTTLDVLELPNTQKMLEAALAISSELKQMICDPRFRYKHTLTATAEQLLTHPEIFKWGTADKLLRIAERYFQTPVAYDGLSLFYSQADAREAGPRKWHRDKYDRKMIKVAVYLNDVDETGGPYQCLTSAANAYLVAKLTSKYKVLTYKKLKSLLPLSNSDWLVSCAGRAGTVIFTDTARYYHRGKPPIKRDRSVIFYTYFSRRPKHPFYCSRSPLSDRQLAQLADSLPTYLRDCITWKKQLTGLSRYIPKNKVKI